MNIKTILLVEDNDDDVRLTLRAGGRAILRIVDRVDQRGTGGGIGEPRFLCSKRLHAKFFPHRL